MSDRKYKEYSLEDWQSISENLNKQLGPEYLSQRPGPGGRPLTYIEGKTAINIANDIFGFNGWSTDIKDITVDFLDVNDDGRVSIGVAVTVRITLTDGSYHEDIGYGSETNARNKAQAFEKARKTGVTDATKRALRNFGNALGNCLYDTPYLGGIGKMAKPTIKFTAKNLYRHQQFEAPKTEVTPPAPKPLPPPQQRASTSNQPVKHTIPQQKAPLPIPSKPVQTTPSKPTTSIDDQKHKQAQVEAARKSLMEPVIPEDSFSYEGDDEFLVQMLAADDEMQFHVDDDIDNEMLAGIITPPPLSISSDPSPSIKREAPSLLESDNDIHLKRQKASQ